MSQKRLEAYVHGFVQGVGFRYFVRRNAVKLNITGFAKNLPNGDVQVVAEGEEKDLIKLLGILREGNSFSHVENVDYEFKEPKGDLLGFEIY